eukprot:m.368295 g.368295  ORF g.368295 m.368295 type:complete len:434 (+) comp16666_c1_seq37:96-1397(+)
MIQRATLFLVIQQTATLVKAAGYFSLMPSSYNLCSVGSNNVCVIQQMQSQGGALCQWEWHGGTADLVTANGQFGSGHVSVGGVYVPDSSSLPMISNGQLITFNGLRSGVEICATPASTAAPLPAPPVPSPPAPPTAPTILMPVPSPGKTAAFALSATASIAAFVVIGSGIAVFGARSSGLGHATAVAIGMVVSLVVLALMLTPNMVQFHFSVGSTEAQVGLFRTWSQSKGTTGTIEMYANNCDQDQADRHAITGCFAQPTSECCFDLAARCKASKGFVVSGFVLTILATIADPLRRLQFPSVFRWVPCVLALLASVAYCALGSTLIYTQLGPASIKVSGHTLLNEVGSCGYSDIKIGTATVTASLSAGFGLVAVVFVLSVAQAALYRQSVVAMRVTDEEDPHESSEDIPLLDIQSIQAAEAESAHVSPYENDA